MEPRDINTGGLGRDNLFARYKKDIDTFKKQFSEISKSKIELKSRDVDVLQRSRMDPRRIIFAALFMAGKLRIEDLAQIAKMEKKDVKRILFELERETDPSLEIIRDKETCELRVREKYLPVIAPLCPKADFNEAELRTLALIAYYQPVRRLDIVKHRGVLGHVHANKFIEMGFVSEKESKLSTTERFSWYFGVQGMNKEELRKTFEATPEVK